MQLRSRAESDELSTPRFDDERTLLSARPVVPLAEIPRLKSKWRFSWKPGAIGAGVITLVIAAALTVSRNAKPTQSQTASEPQVTAQVPQSANEETGDGPSTPADSESDTPSQPKRQAPKVKVAIENSEKPERVRKSTVAPPDDDRISEDIDEQIEEQRLRREARREERRFERRARRDAWRRAQDRDDVFRINDIFEGRRRRP